MRHKPVVKLSRSLQLPLTAKATKIMEVRSYRPGEHGRARHNLSDYGQRLREKQRLRAQYFVSERYLRAAYAEASRRGGPTGDNLLADLERRLDATVLRAGFARTIYQARQLVSHGHVLVDGKRVDIPSAQVDLYETVSIKPKSHELPIAAEAKEGTISTAPGYLEVNRTNLSAVHIRAPRREEIPVICDVQLVVEFYAR